MISARTVQHHWFPLLKMAHHTITIPFHYNNQIFMLTIERTPDTYTKRYKKKTKQGTKINTSQCDSCKHLQVNGICINKRCTQYQVQQESGTSYNIKEQGSGSIEQ